MSEQKQARYLESAAICVTTIMVCTRTGLLPPHPSPPKVSHNNAHTHHGDGLLIRMSRMGSIRFDHMPVIVIHHTHMVAAAHMLFFSRLS